jgi:hypothetical protein
LAPPGHAPGVVPAVVSVARVTTSTPVFDTVNVWLPLVRPPTVWTLKLRAPVLASGSTKKVAVIEFAPTFKSLTLIPLLLLTVVAPGTK